MIAVGELARRASVKISTIRYYEQVGFIDPGVRACRRSLCAALTGGLFAS